MKIHQVTNAEQLIAVAEAARANGHYAIPATDFWTDDNGEIRGYFACNNVPVGHFWMHTESTPRESYRIIKACEQITIERGIKAGMIACHKSSPFYDMIERHFGFQKVTDTTLFYKDLSNAHQKRS